MWKIKDVKKSARHNLKRNYWAAVAVAFLMLFIVSEYSASSMLFTGVGDDTMPLEERGHITGETISASDIIAYYTEDIFNYEPSTEVSPGTQGFFAAVINGAARSLNVIKYSVQAVNHFLLNHHILQGLLALLLILINLLFYIFVKNILIVGERRFLLENRCYHDTQVRRLFYLYRERKIMNPAVIMLKKTIFNILWAFTIVGGVYKFYEYRMIRFILAENPDIDSKSCFRLSKEMMRGAKWKLFLQDLSFLPWYVVNTLTLGLAGWFYVNPYCSFAEAEVYFVLRDRAYAEGLKGFELLNDDYLVNEPEEREVDIYPSLMLPHKNSHLTNWKKYYHPVNIAMMFFSFMFIGWVWEVFYSFMLHGELVNRGSLHGPWLPIYGFGGIMIVILFRKLGDKPHLMFLLAFVSCGIMEYITGWFFDNVKGIKYWDYSNYFMNLNGYICLEGLLMFSVLACAGFYFIAPMLDDFYGRIPMKYRTMIICILGPIFCFDVIYSHFIPNEGKGIGGKNYNQ